MHSAKSTPVSRRISRELPNPACQVIAVLAGLLAAMLLIACVTSGAEAAPSRALYRAQRLCAAPRPGSAECLGMRLIAKSLSKEELRASARRQAREVAAGVKPHVSSKSVPGGLTPAALHEAYGLPSETAASASQTIGIVDAYDDPTAEADLAVYDRAFGLPECTTANGCFRKINQSGKASPKPPRNGEWATEISLDVQMAHAICQTCKILLVEATSETWGNLGAAVNAAVSAGATEVSNSYGGAESGSYSGLSTPYYDHPGVVVTVSSGDCGYYNQGCEGSAAADFPASAPNVVAVGGTSLSKGSGGWTSTVWNNGGSGCSHVFTARLWQSTAENFSASGCGTGRSVADIAAVGDPYTGVDVYDSTPAGSGASTGWGVWGGTSAASPIVAAEFALGGGARSVGYPSATIYSHVGESASLYDVVSGTNGSCSGATACKAAAGYDGPTGVGSPLGTGAFTVAGAPANLSAPSISGTAEAGQTLTATPGTWSASPTSTTYQWQLCNASGALCSVIAGATSHTLTLGATTVGATVRVVVTAGNASGSSAPTASPASTTVASNQPAISSFTPASGITGSTVLITGSGLKAASGVHFGALAATFTALSGTQIEATIPSGAVAATISVTTPVKTVASAAKFTPTLSVVKEAPSRAAAGTLITITGAGFNESSVVSFNGTQASGASVVSSTTIKVKVPSGASTGLITVSNTAAPVGTVKSAGSFVVA